MITTNPRHRFISCPNGISADDPDSDYRELVICGCGRLIHVQRWQPLPWGPDKSPSVICPGCGVRLILD